MLSTFTALPNSSPTPFSLSPPKKNSLFKPPIATVPESNTQLFDANHACTSSNAEPNSKPFHIECANVVAKSRKVKKRRTNGRLRRNSFYALIRRTIISFKIFATITRLIALEMHHDQFEDGHKCVQKR